MLNPTGSQTVINKLDQFLWQVKSLSHTRWECNYHIVFIPKYRKKVIFGQIKKEFGEVFRRLAKQKESWIEEGHSF